MGILSFDGKNEEPAGGFELYPADTYTLEILSFERGTSSNGNPQMKVGMAIKGGDFNGKPYTDWLSLTDKALWRVKAFFWAAGATLPKVDLDTSGELFMRLCNELKGHELAANIGVKVNPNTAKENNNIEQFMRTEDPWELDVNQVDGDIPDFVKS